MPQNSTIIPSLFYHLSSSLRHHSVSVIHTTYHHHFASIQSFIIISPLFRLYFTTYHHHFVSIIHHLSSSFRHHSVSILPPIIINAPSFRLNHSHHLSSSFHHYSASI